MNAYVIYVLGLLALGFFSDRIPAEKMYLELIKTCKISSLPSLQGEVLPRSLFVQSYHVPTDQ